MSGFAAFVVSVFVLFSASKAVNSDHGQGFYCRRERWVAEHMREQLGWSVEKSKRVAAAQCRAEVERNRP